jgi:hypothetical protein
MKETTYSDDLNKSVDNKILDFNFKAVGFLAAVFYKPLATASDPFFRKNMGERYFTSTSLGLGAFLYLAASACSKLTDGLFQLLAKALNQDFLVGLLEQASKYYVSTLVGAAVTLAFFVLGRMNLRAVARRQATGEVWHSMSRGESITGQENPTKDRNFLVLVAIILFCLAPLVGLLFVVSRILSLSLVAKEQASIYARYLDAMDAKISAEYLERALRDGEPPRITQGLYGPLPAHFKGQHRANVAHLGAGGGVPVRVAVAPGIGQAPATASVSSAAPSSPQTPTAVEPFPAKPDVAQPTMSAKTKGRVVLFLVAIILVAGASYMIQMWHGSLSSLHPVAVVNQSAPATHSPEPTTPPTESTQPAKIQEPLPTSITAQEIPDQPAVSHVVDSVQLPAPAQPTQTAAVDPELQRKQAAEQVEQERLQKETAQTIEQMQQMIREQAGILASFKTNYEAKYVANSNRIQSLRPNGKKELTHYNDATQTEAIRIFHLHDDGLQKWQALSAKFAKADLKSLQQVAAKIDRTSKIVTTNCGKVIAQFNVIAGAISKAEAGGGGMIMAK